MLDSLRAEVTRLEVWAFSKLSQWDVSVREHEEILDAVEVGDYDRALATIEENRLMTYTHFGEHTSATGEVTRDASPTSPKKANCWPYGRLPHDGRRHTVTRSIQNSG